MKSNIISIVILAFFSVASLNSNYSKSIIDNFKSSPNMIFKTENNLKCQNTIKEFDDKPLENIIKNIFNNRNYDNFSTKEYNWYFLYRGTGKTPDPPQETVSFRSKYNSYYIGDTTKKIIYLTFDEGYENGYTATILDVLKRHNVKAAFFVVKPYLTTNPELVKRMVMEGHLVCNHSSHHPSMASIIDKDKFNKELIDVEIAYEEITGKKMPKYFRPPMGKYSELSLHNTQSLGYKTIFWSFAYNDWQINKQPDPIASEKRIIDRTHNGAIILLHAVSKTNAEILDNVLTQWEKEGYKIEGLDKLPN
jgi:peptidoglycan-N-acetylmuramic acid deacetylase